MAEFVFPGIYLEESGNRPKPIEGVATSTTAFVGMTARGPVSRLGSCPPHLLTSYSAYERLYGGPGELIIGGVAQPNYLALAVRSFFMNGGARLHVARVPGAAAAAGSAPTGGKGPAIAFVALEAGGSRIAGTEANFRITVRQDERLLARRLAIDLPPGSMVRLETDYLVLANGILADAQGNADAFAAAADDADCALVTISIEVQGPEGSICRLEGLGLHPEHPLFIGGFHDADGAGTDVPHIPVRLVMEGDATAFDLRDALMEGAVDGLRIVEVQGGSDGDGPPAMADYQAALDGLLALDDVSIVAAPGASSFAAQIPAAINQMLIAHCESPPAYRFAVLDTPPGLGIADVRALRSAVESKSAAIYYPWIRVANPLAPADPAQPGEIDVPPSGAVCGIYARSDLRRGVWKAPANESVTGATGLQRDVSLAEQGVLNPLGVNCIRALPNRGIRLWGARTLSSKPEWRYVNVRRYFIYLEASIDRGTKWAVFEPNGETLWSAVRSMIEAFLHGEWARGALQGSKPEDAFFVRCDRSIMAQSDIDAGRLLCLVGVAPVRPAEYVVFRIGQWTAGSG